MTSSQIIVLATPVFFALIGIEYLVGRLRGRNTYRLNDAISSIALGLLSQVSGVFSRFLQVGIYTAIFSLVALVPDSGFWSSTWGWLLALLLYDFCYYWHHRLGHTCAVLWGAHVVHHQSEDYNLSTALRQTSSGVLLGWVFYLPMAVAGVPPLIFAVVGLINLLYQYWIHTQQIGQLGWFDRVFASPSNHRVHHAVNDRYLDKNFGGIFILWDRLFGSFELEDPKEPCVYGTRSPLRSWDPLWANAEGYVALGRASWRARSWNDKWKVWLMPPGWQSQEMALHSPHPAFDLGQVTTFAPSMSRRVKAFAGVQFVGLILGASFYLWQSDSAPMWQNGIWFSVLLASTWAVGAVMQGRISITEALMIESAALAMATAATGWLDLHRVFKPLTMLIAMAAVAIHASQIQAMQRNHAQRVQPAFSRRLPWLTAALVGSLAGDAFLMWEGYFIPGLVSFLLAHVAYIGLFGLDAPWLAAKRAWWITAALGILVYGLLWTGGLPVELRAAVAVYVLAIVTMASTAMGRAQTLQDGPSWAVAIGSAFFMLSDTVLAVNRFVSPLPHSAVWVLGTYYIAQCLIVMGMLRMKDQVTERRSPSPSS